MNAALRAGEVKDTEHLYCGWRLLQIVIVRLID